jgi:hypothetical protein
MQRRERKLDELDEDDEAASSSSSGSGCGTDEDAPLVKSRPREKEKEIEDECKSHAAIDQKLKEAKVRTAAKMAALAETRNSFPSEQYPVSDIFITLLSMHKLKFWFYARGLRLSD